MDPDDIADILSRLTTEPYVTQEVRFNLQDYWVADRNHRIPIK